MAAPFSMMLASTAGSLETLVQGLLYGEERRGHAVDNAVARRPAEGLEEYLIEVGILAPNRPRPIASIPAAQPHPNRR